MATKPSESSSSTVCEAEIPKNEESSTLKLKLQKKERKKIQWTEDTVDNEGLGKKKSKICCVYSKPRKHLDDSSSEDEDSDHCSGH